LPFPKFTPKLPLFGGIAFSDKLLDYSLYNSGTAQPKLNKRTCKTIPVLKPSYEEQRAIAEVLEDVDDLLASLDRLIAKKRAVKLATMQQLLTGEKRLAGWNDASYKKTEIGTIPDDWDIQKIGDLASITTGSRNTQDRKESGKYPFFVRSQNVERINSYSFDGEAVLTAGDGVGTGKVFHYINGKFDYHQRVYKISNFKPELDGFYFYMYFSNHFYNRIMSMTAKSSVDSVRMEMIADMLIPLPSRAEQRAIATILSDMDAEISALQARRDKTAAIKQGMMQQLLTGQTRLTT
jgi:type I restriction enzyme, S subunit